MLKIEQNKRFGQLYIEFRTLEYRVCSDNAERFLRGLKLADTVSALNKEITLDVKDYDPDVVEALLLALGETVTAQSTALILADDEFID